MGGLRGLEVAKGAALAVKRDIRLPLGCALVPVDPFETGCVGPAAALIPGILCVSSKPQVTTSVIKRIAVDMVDVEIFRRVHDGAVKSHGALLSVAVPSLPHGIHAMWLHTRTPSVLANQRNILDVDDGLMPLSQSQDSNIPFDTGSRV